MMCFVFLQKNRICGKAARKTSKTVKNRLPHPAALGRIKEERNWREKYGSNASHRKQLGPGAGRRI